MNEMRDISPKSKSIADIPSPIQLYIEITNACNLCCEHCYLRAGQGIESSLEPTLLKQILQEFQALGGHFVTFSGGEPTLYSKWKWAIQSALSLGLEPTLLTNAQKFSQSDLDFLSESKIKISISLDGMSETTHDSIRGHGSFSRTINNILRLVNSGLGSFITICFTPMSINFKEIPSIAEFANALGLSGIYVSLLENRGRATLDFDKRKLTDDDKCNLLFELFSLQNRYRNLDFYCSNLGFFIERVSGLSFDNDKLERTIRIDPQGEVFLTAYLEAEPFHLGSSRSQNLEDLWLSPKVEKALLEAERRRSTLEGCHKCDVWHWCQGGSATLGWAENGSFSKVDSYCSSKKKIAKDLLLPQKITTD